MPIQALRLSIMRLRLPRPRVHLVETTVAADIADRNPATRNKLTDYWKEHDVKEGRETLNAASSFDGSSLFQLKNIISSGTAKILSPMGIISWPV